MSVSARFLSPAEASERLGVSAKALRLYERHGLLAPIRSAAGYRAYGPDQMARAREIAALRQLGLSLGQVSRVFTGDGEALATALAGYQSVLEDRLSFIAAALEKLLVIRGDLANGKAPPFGALATLIEPACALEAEFNLPWPWGGEQFHLRDIRSLNFIVGPLGSGKTRLAKRISEVLDGAFFFGLDRLSDRGASAHAKLDADSDLKSRVDRSGVWLTEEGGTMSDALLVLLTELEIVPQKILVIDMLEQGMDKATQEALMTHLRRRCASRPPIFVLTRSSAILDLDAVEGNEAIIFCPANHSPPTRVAAVPGSPGYEAVATCLASPEVRARTEGVIAWRPHVA